MTDSPLLRTAEEKVCAVAGCDNSNLDGRFVGDFCAPCDTAIRTGLIGHGTSFIYMLAAENSRLRAELAYYEDEGEPHIERAICAEGGQGG